MWSLLERAKKVIFALVLSIIPVVLLYVQGKDAEIRGVISWPVTQVAGLLSSAAVSVTGLMSDTLFRYVFLVGRSDELARLRADVVKLRALQAQVTDLTFEREEILNTYFHTDYGDQVNRVYARVIATAGAPMARMVRINRGFNHGLKVGNPVVANEGVVGQILSLSANFSDVLLMTDASSAIDARVVGLNARGLLRGITSNAEYLMEIGNLDGNDQIKPGDVIVSSGVNTQFPQGIPVGFVKNISASKDGLWSSAQVTPFVAMDRLEHVAVLTQSVQTEATVKAIFAPWPMATK
jgi:rod shape-determining protein MreC